jgi:hypothetical protein
MGRVSRHDRCAADGREQRDRVESGGIGVNMRVRKENEREENAS